MRILPLTILAALALQPLAKADKFWLEPQDRKNAVEGSKPAVLDGVLLDESATHYHLRVLGGEVWLAKKKVVAVEKDALTAADLVKAEKSQAERLAAADQERQREQAAATIVVAAAKSAPAIGAALEANCSTCCHAPAYDPVIHALAPAKELSDCSLIRELDLAYSMTRDRSYLKMLRKLRRLR